MTKTALVLGGGGVTGIAWEIGILAGLADAGLDLTDADVFIGTSAGSVVAALIAGGERLEAAFASQLEPPGIEPAVSFGVLLGFKFLWSTLWSRTPHDFAKRVGKISVGAQTMPEADRRAVIAARLPLHEWPERALRVTAVDVESGERRVFERGGDAGLVDAVGASCAVPGIWPPVTIAGHRYMDGGMLSATNADLASGFSRVVVIAPIPGRIGPTPSVNEHAAELRRGGSAVSIVAPDAAALRAIGPNRLDVSRRAASAQAGRTQAVSVLAAVKAVWQGTAMK